MQSYSSLTAPSSASSSTSASSASIRQDRLFIGNLAPSVDEYSLVQIFSKFGKITKLDFMFHKSGPMKGKPRGYAFVEFSNKDDALKALVKLNDRLLRGRKLVVTLANVAPPTDDSGSFKNRKSNDNLKPTTLSLLKSQRKPGGAEAQIAAMEAKLAAMQKRPGRSPPPTSFSSSSSTAATLGVDVEIGREESERAVDELEREVRLELGSKEGEQDIGGEKGQKRAVDKTVVKESTEEDKDREKNASEAVNSTLRGVAGLPPKPTFT